MPHRPNQSGVVMLAVAAMLAVGSAARAQTAPAPPTDLRAKDVTNFARDVIRVRWTNPTDDRGGRRVLYELSRATAPEGPYDLVAPVGPAAVEYQDDSVTADTAYYYQLVAVGEGTPPNQVRSDPVRLAEAVTPTVGAIAGFQRKTSEGVPLIGGILWNRRWLFVITLIICGAVIYWIEHARKGGDLKLRKIAGLEAVDEAVGRATEMGRSCLFVPGIQDMNDIQTIAGITVLARVARTAAEYDAKVEVPTARALVMTTARETVQASYLAAGRPEAYNEDLIYYVSDEQFGYVAYLQGMMVREKPAACFYMGSFFAESLILAETGNSIGAIQVAGTAQPAQLPFFVAACDYTLIGEEFFAASAYLSGSPEELGSLKGADVGKVLVAAGIGVGVLLATLAELMGSETLADAVTYLKSQILT